MVSIEDLGQRLNRDPAPGTIVIKADSAASHALVIAVVNLALSRGIPAGLATSDEP